MAKSLFNEPKVLITGVEGAGKTLFAVQQSDLLAKEEGGELYQLNIRGADPHHLPKLPFPIDELAFNADGSAVVDPETGDHLPRWATLPSGSVIIVDEAHKVFPQRGPGRPPKWIEMLAEGRQHGIRFVLMSQSPASIDGFLRDRISVHYHLERKGGMERATIFEFSRCVQYPQTAWQERKDAQLHLWAYPKEYYGWYKSAKAHTFKLKIPWKIFAALLFVPLALWGIYNVVGKVGGLSENLAQAKESASGPQASKRSGEGNNDTLPLQTDPDKYRAQFAPIDPVSPWSAPAYQGREVLAKPEVYCMASGVDGRDGCRCFTEQATPYAMPSGMCLHIARNGNYNPFREPLGADLANNEGDSGKPAEPRLGASGVPGPGSTLIERPPVVTNSTGTNFATDG